jgi:hypothetical protein
MVSLARKEIWSRGIFYLIGILGESPFVSKLREAESAPHSPARRDTLRALDPWESTGMVPNPAPPDRACRDHQYPEGDTLDRVLRKRQPLAGKGIIVCPKRELLENMRAIRITFIFGFVAIIIVACSSDISVTPTVNVLPTQTQFRKTVTPTASETPRPTLTITSTPTVDKIAALASEFNIPAVCLFTYRVSNDQNWIGADCPLYRELIIANKFVRKSVFLPYQEIEKEASTNFSTRPLIWSSDNRYLYFTTRCCNYNDSDNSNGSLYRFDSEKESWSILVHAVYGPFYFFSDDGERYVYLNHQPLGDSGYPEHLEIGMVDVLSNRNKRLVLKYYWGPLYEKPEYTWSRNGDEFSIVLQKVIAVHPHTIDFKKVRLKINFSHWSMELEE